MKSRRRLTIKKCDNFILHYADSEITALVYFTDSFAIRRVV